MMIKRIIWLLLLFCALHSSCIGQAVKESNPIQEGDQLTRIGNPPLPTEPSEEYSVKYQKGSAIISANMADVAADIGNCRLLATDNAFNARWEAERNPNDANYFYLVVPAGLSYSAILECNGKVNAEIYLPGSGSELIPLIDIAGAAENGIAEFNGTSSSASGVTVIDLGNMKLVEDISQLDLCATTSGLRYIIPGTNIEDIRKVLGINEAINYLICRLGSWFTSWAKNIDVDQNGTPDRDETVKMLPEDLKNQILSFENIFGKNDPLFVAAIENIFMRKIYSLGIGFTNTSTEDPRNFVESGDWTEPSKMEEDGYNLDLFANSNDVDMNSNFVAGEHCQADNIDGLGEYPIYLRSDTDIAWGSGICPAGTYIKARYMTARGNAGFMRGYGIPLTANYYIKYLQKETGKVVELKFSDLSATTDGSLTDLIIPKVRFERDADGNIQTLLIVWVDAKDEREISGGDLKYYTQKDLTGNSIFIEILNAEKFPLATTEDGSFKTALQAGSDTVYEAVINTKVPAKNIASIVVSYKDLSNNFHTFNW